LNTAVLLKIYVQDLDYQHTFLQCCKVNTRLHVCISTYNGVFRLPFCVDIHKASSI